MRPFSDAASKPSSLRYTASCLVPVTRSCEGSIPGNFLPSEFATSSGNVAFGYSGIARVVGGDWWEM